MSQDDPQPHDRRTDRRRANLPVWHPRRLRGRRMRMRRDTDKAQPYAVDRVSWPVFALAILLLLLTLADGLITVALLDHGFEEANPLMRLMLERGTSHFFVVKYVLTALFLPVALVMNHYRLFGSRLRVGHLIPIAVALYLVLIAYQCTLWHGRQPPAENRLGVAAAGRDEPLGVFIPGAER
jgi:hypothetical protein